MTKFALLIEYNGANYHGWQAQSGIDTIQGRIENALSRFADEPLTIFTAGRTDTGVHALNQVVHFYSNARRNLYGWVNGVNARLPAAIRVKQSAVVDEGFDARFSATRRTYHYYLVNHPVKPAILNGLVGWYPHFLDATGMSEAAAFLVGRLDFSSFRAANCQANSPVREIFTAKVEKKGNLLRFEFTANAFLYHMIRNIVGALVYVGAGRLGVSDFGQLIGLKSRSKAPPTFMADGLYLANIEYPDPPFNLLGDDYWLFGV